MASGFYQPVRIPESAQKARPTLRELQASVVGNPRDASAHHALGKALLDRGEYTGAIETLRQARALRSNVAAVHYDLADALSAAGAPVEAAESYEAAVVHQPDWAGAYRRAAKIRAMGLEQWDRALGLLRDAIRLEPGDRSAHSDLGRCCLQGRAWREALGAAQKIAPFVEDARDLHRGVAKGLERYCRYSEAWECWRELLRESPDDAGGLAGLARICEAHKDDRTAAAYYERALARDPEFGMPFFFFLFKTGDLERARAVFQSVAPAPLADGLKGKTVLLNSMYGYGDTFQFVRFAALAEQSGATVILRCAEGARALMEAAPGVKWAVAPYDEHPPADLEIDLFLEFYEMLDVPFERAAGGVPYLSVPAELRREWRERIAPSAGFHVGIVWAAHGAVRNNRYQNRSASLALFEPLARIPGVRLYSLQKGPAMQELSDGSAGFRVADLAGDFLNTAAAMLALNVVVTVDTAAAHLAGALGVPVLVMLPYQACFRWQSEREDTPWYPTMKLYRQNSPGDWQDVVSRVAREVARFAE